MVQLATLRQNSPRRYREVWEQCALGSEIRSRRQELYQAGASSTLRAIWKYLPLLQKETSTGSRSCDSTGTRRSRRHNEYSAPLLRVSRRQRDGFDGLQEGPAG